MLSHCASSLRTLGEPMQYRRVPELAAILALSSKLMAETSPAPCEAVLTVCTASVVFEASGLREPMMIL
jgi:hypothetical protein